MPAIADKLADRSKVMMDGGVRGGLDVFRARALGAVVVLGSATPSLESWHNVSEGRLRKWSLTSRPEARALPASAVQFTAEFAGVAHAGETYVHVGHAEAQRDGNVRNKWCA